MSRANISDTLSSILVALDVSQGVLAAAVDIDHSTVSAWACGRSCPGGHRLVTLCDWLCCTPDDLYGYRALTADRLEQIRQRFDRAGRVKRGVDSGYSYMRALRVREKARRKRDGRTP